MSDPLKLESFFVTTSTSDCNWSLWWRVTLATVDKKKRVVEPGTNRRPLFGIHLQKITLLWDRWCETLEYKYEKCYSDQKST